MDKLASEEDANPQLEDGTESSAFSFQTRASPAEELSFILLPPLSTANEELPPLPLLSQYHNISEWVNISVAANYSPISSDDHLPSPGPVLRQPALPRTRSWSTRMRAWFAKRSGSLKR